MLLMLQLEVPVALGTSAPMVMVRAVLVRGDPLASLARECADIVFT